DCRPENASLVFNAPVPRQTLAGIQWQPIPTKDAAELRRAWDNASDTGSSKPGYLSASRESYGNFLPFELQPAQDYELFIPADSTDSFGSSVGKEVRMQFRTAHRAPRLSSPRNRGVLETDEPTIMPLKLVNLNRLTMGYQQLDFRALNTGDVTTTPKQVELLNRAKLQGNKDEIIQGQLGIRELLDGQSGLVWGTLDWAPDGPTEPRQFSGQVTPWNVFAKVGYYDTLVWVTRLADGQPVANASV